MGKMSNEWARQNLTEPRLITGTKFRDRWIPHPELTTNPPIDDDDEQSDT